MTPFELAWISGHYDRLDRGTDRKKPWHRVKKAVLSGLDLAWERPDVLAFRLAELLAAEPDSYRCAAMNRTLCLMPELPDVRAFFAAACTNTAGRWSVQLDRARPALDLVAGREGGGALAADVARAVLAATQPDRESKQGRPPTGVLEELRDLGLTACRLDYETTEQQAAAFHIDPRDLRKIHAAWRPHLPA